MNVREKNTIFCALEVPKYYSFGRHLAKDFIVVHVLKSTSDSINKILVLLKKKNFFLTKREIVMDCQIIDLLDFASSIKLKFTYY